MLNAKANNDLDWKSRLDELDSLPWEGTGGKKEAWEKLHLRINGNSNRKRIAWYWLAAACIPVFLVITMITTLHYRRMPVIVKVKNMSPQNFSSKQKMVPLKDQDILTLVAPKKAIQQTFFKTKKVKLTVPGSDTVNDHKNNISVTVSISNQQSLDIIDKTVPGDSVATNPVPLIAKKKLRVVHVNELGMPVEDADKETDFANKPSIYRKFMSQEAVYKSSASVNTNSNGIMKIKLNFQN